MKIIFLASFLFCFTFIFAQDSTKIDWVSDIKYLKKQLPLHHVDFFSQRSNTVFKNELDDLSDHLEGLDNFAVTIKLQQIISRFGDSHTGLAVKKYIEKDKILPIQLNWFKDGIYFIKVPGGNELFLGKKLLKLNNFPLQQLIDSLSTILTVDNRGVLKKSIPNMIAWMQLLEHFGFVKDNTCKFDLYDPATRDTLKSIPLVFDKKNALISVKRDSVPITLQNWTKLFSHMYFPEDKIYFIQYNECWSKELEIQYNHGKNVDSLPSFMVFEREVLSDLKKLEVNKLIFDLRNNGGGNSEQGTLFIEQLHEIKEQKKEMQVYVFVGRRTYSSAIINALDFEDFENIKYIGDETSGRPNHFGDVRQFKLPSSGLEVSYSTKYFEMTQKYTNTLMPDIYIISTLSDYISGIDPSFDWVKAQ